MLISKLGAVSLVNRAGALLSVQTQVSGAWVLSKNKHSWHTVNLQKDLALYKEQAMSLCCD